MARHAQELIESSCAWPPHEPEPWRFEARVGGVFAREYAASSSASPEAGPDPATRATLRGQLPVPTRVGRAGGAPYEPGVLALREGPLIEAAVQALPVQPAVLVVDATGRDHPRHAGLALHLGAVLDLATVGVTHHPLVAEGEWRADERGARSSLLREGGARRLLAAHSRRHAR